MEEIRLPSFNDFSPEILRGDLRTCLEAIKLSGGNDQSVIEKWRNLYFSGVVNKRSSTNIPATLKSTGLTTGTRPLALSNIGESILNAPNAKEAARIFCKHLIEEKNGNLVIAALSALGRRKAKVTKESLKLELTSLGVTALATATTDHTTLKNWMIHAGLVTDEGSPIDSELKGLMGISSSENDEFLALPLGQQVFLQVLRRRQEAEPGPFQTKDIFRECRENFPHLFDEAQFAKQVRSPLEQQGWIESDGLATGVHGGRSGQIKGSPKLLGIPLSRLVPDFDQVVPADLRARINTSLEEIRIDLFGTDTYKAGMALELLALRMIIDLGLSPRHFRLRSSETAYAEVDLIAEGTHLMFSRWTFQCKRYGRDTKTKLNLGDVAKEVGIAIFTRAHVIVMVTTTDFSRDAKEYAAEVTRSTHLQFVFIDGKLIDRYLEKGTDELWTHFQANAKEVIQEKRQQKLAASN